ncbi:MAG: sulfatase-like hydrolase/transferase [Planctomycetes bacterium]|nr:sulfatase-like hydrolase/transferase [Planctomycetota bacterium]
MNKSTRRDFLKGVGIGAVSLGLPVWSAGAAAGRKKPNVLFIAVDDLNDWIGCLGGHPDARTPNIDRLAKRGVLFSNAHCAAPACNPSRAALMTGVRPWTSGVYMNPNPWRRSPVLKNAAALPQHFMAHGYRAMGSGKIYHGSFPDPASWDEYWPSQTQNKPPDPLPDGRPLNGIPRTSHFDWGPVDADKTEMGDWKVADWVIGQLNKKHDKPFFLACGMFRPHLPWYVPKEYFDLYPLDKIKLPTIKEDDLDDVPPIGRKMSGGRDHRNVIKYNQWRKAVQGYLASISFTDECIGRVLDAFDKSAYTDNTIIVFWADHGWHLGEKLHWRKFALWEEATHNPMMFVVPGLTKAGGRCRRPVNLIDIYPTLVDVCGLTPKAELEGVSLKPLLLNPQAKWDRPSLTTYGRGNHSVRSERWRYIRYSDGTEELYDHDADEMEWTNLASDPKYARVKKDLAKWLPKTDVPEISRDKGKKSQVDKSAQQKKNANKKVIL